LFSGSSLIGNTKNGVYIYDQSILSLAGTGPRPLTIQGQTLSIYTGTTYSEKLKVFENGNLVISTSPSDAGYKLDVNGTVRFSGTLTSTSANFSSTTSHTGTATFGAGSPTAIDGTDGKLIIPKIRVYNSAPATQYHDITSAALSNRFIIIPDASGTMALTSDLSGYLPLTGGTLTGALNGTTAAFSGNTTIGGNDGAATRLYVRTEDTANTPSLTLFKNVSSGTAEDIFRVQSWNGAFNTVASIRANGSANFLSSVSATSLRSSTVGTFGFNTASNGEFQIYSTAESGLVMAGRGSSFDMVITNKNGADTIRIPTGTTNVNFVGNVGIGTASPSGRLHILDSAIFRSATDYVANTYEAVFSESSTGGSNVYPFNSNGNLVIQPRTNTGAARDIVFATGSNTPSTRMIINSGGNVLIGTTTDSGYKLQVNGASYLDGYNYASSIQYTRAPSNTVAPASGNGILVFAGGNAQMRMDTANQICFDMNNAGNPFTVLTLKQSDNTVSINSLNNNLMLELKYQNVASGYLGAIGSALYGYSVNGGYVLLNASSVWVPASDVKRKRNFEPYELGLNAIIGLKPKLYNMDFQKDGDEKQVGLVAQEVREFIPLAYEENNDFIGVNYNAIIVTMVKAMQELKAELDELKNNN
jgi:hypothetical protein